MPVAISRTAARRLCNKSNPRAVKRCTVFTEIKAEVAAPASVSFVTVNNNKWISELSSVYQSVFCQGKTKLELVLFVHYQLVVHFGGSLEQNMS